MKRRVLVDTGPLVAFLNRRDQHHAWVKSQLTGIQPPLITCEAVISEACFLLRHQRRGPEAVLELFERGLLQVDLDFDHEVAAIKELVRRYANVPMALADACMVRLAELNPGSSVLTLDTDFEVYRMHRRKVIPTIMPR